MAVSRVGTASYSATSGSVPAHQAGDLIVIFAYRDGSNTAPALPGGFTNMQNGGANTNSCRCGFKIAASSGETSGTWTNATGIVIVVYRGVDQTDPIGDNTMTGAASTTVNYPAITLENTDGTSWVGGFAGHRSTNTNLQNPPSGMTNQVDLVDATDEIVLHDTNGGVSSWSSTNVSVSGTSSGYRSVVFEIKIGYTAVGLSEELSDDFDDNSVDTAKWVPANDPGVTITETGGKAQFALSSSVGFGYYVSKDYYDLTDSWFYTKLDDPGTSQTEESDVIVCDVWKDGNNALFFIVSGDTLYAQYYKNGGATQTLRSDGAYNSTTMKYFRLREHAGYVLWEYAQFVDGPWTIYTRATIATVFSVSVVKLRFGTGIWGTAGSMTVKFDDMNVGATFVETSVEVTTLASSDDAAEVVSSTVVNITDDGSAGTTSQIYGLNSLGFRFPNVPLDQGRSIDRVLLKFDNLANYSGTGTLSNVTLYGQNVDNAAAFTTTNADISGRARTTANVAGANMAATQAVFITNGLDVTALVQEILNRGGWANGNALALLFIGNGTTSNFIRPYMYDYSGGGFYKTRLVIEYSETYTPPAATFVPQILVT